MTSERDRPIEQLATIPLPEDVFCLSRVFQAADHLLYVVGGAVRDFLLGQNPKDVDLATDAAPEKVGEILSRSVVRNFPKGEAFGVWVAHVNGEDYEIATFREDVGVGDGRHPESVRWCSPAADARRRDLTINALFYQIPATPGEPGKILDYFDGQALQDVKNLIVRVVGDPFDRFAEDRLRVLRLPRFHARFSDRSLVLDSRTQAALDYYKQLRYDVDKFHPERGRDVNTLGQPVRLEPVSGERIQQEFESGLLKSKNPASFLKTYHELELLPVVFPGLAVNLSFAGPAARVPQVVLALILRDNDCRQVSIALNRLHWPNAVVDEVVFLLKTWEAAKTAAPEAMSTMAVELEKKTGRRRDLQTFFEALMLKEEKLWRHFVQYESPIFSGEYVMRRFGIESPGPEVGRRQRELRAEHYRQSYSDYLQKNT